LCWVLDPHVEPLHPSFPQIGQDLEELKRTLIGMTYEDIDPVDAEAVAREISAIRLQLKRITADRAWAMERYDAARNIDSGKSAQRLGE
jgi:hypothetical protein